MGRGKSANIGEAFSCSGILKICETILSFIIIMLHRCEQWCNFPFLVFSRKSFKKYWLSMANLWPFISRTLYLLLLNSSEVFFRYWMFPDLLIVSLEQSFRNSSKNMEILKKKEEVLKIVTVTRPHATQTRWQRSVSILLDKFGTVTKCKICNKSELYSKRFSITISPCNGECCWHSRPLLFWKE